MVVDRLRRQVRRKLRRLEALDVARRDLVQTRAPERWYDVVFEHRLLRDALGGPVVGDHVRLQELLVERVDGWDLRFLARVGLRVKEPEDVIPLRLLRGLLGVELLRR